MTDYCPRCNSPIECYCEEEHYEPMTAEQAAEYVRRPLYCSFCGEQFPAGTKDLVMGPSVYICLPCALKAKELLEEQEDGNAT
jgi:hypothetical protein